MAKRSISLPDDLDVDVEQSARLENKSVSAWIADVVAPATKRTLGLAAVAEWEAEHGAFTEEELAEGRAWVDRVLREGSDDHDEPDRVVTR